MTYLSDKEKKKKQFLLRALFVGILVVLIGFWYMVRQSLLPAGYAITEKIFTVSEWVSNEYDSLSHYFTTKSVYEEELQSLEQENDSLRQEIATLRQASTTDDGSGVYHLEVHTLYRPLATFYDSFLISKGFSDGITPGMIVYTSGYLPIGTIDEVHPSTSRVALFSKSGNEFEGFIASSSLVVRLTGNGGGDFIATLPKQASVAIGNSIFLKEYPQMKVGEVVAIDNAPQSVSQVLHVRGAYTTTLMQRYYIDIP